jgi:hypothetical protein
MIELPETPAPNGATPALVDYGGTQRGALGAALRVNRLGSHYRVALTFPPFENETDGRVFVSRLIRAKRRGLRIAFPLLGVDQGGAGTPVLDGNMQAGLSIKVRGLTPGYTCREGFWLSIRRAGDGRHYLYNCSSEITAGLDGRAQIAIEPMLRWPHVDGDQVHLVRPMIEGPVDGDEQAWTLALGGFVGVEVSIEEAG